eukprot:6477288-Amphidinium_carterae.1
MCGRAFSVGTSRSARELTFSEIGQAQRQRDGRLAPSDNPATKQPCAGDMHRTATEQAEKVSISIANYHEEDTVSVSDPANLNSTPRTQLQSTSGSRRYTSALFKTYAPNQLICSPSQNHDLADSRLENEILNPTLWS